MNQEKHQPWDEETHYILGKLELSSVLLWRKTKRPELTSLKQGSGDL